MKNKKIKKVILVLGILVVLILVLSYSKEYINKTITNNKQTSQKMTDASRITELEKQISNLNAEHTSYAEYVQAGKTKIANAITNEGVATSENDTFDTMSNNIAKILKAKTSDATATQDNIVKGKTAYVNGQKITGKLEGIEPTLLWTNPSSAPFTPQTVALDLSGYKAILIICSSSAGAESGIFKIAENASGSIYSNVNKSALFTGTYDASGHMAGRKVMVSTSGVSFSDCWLRNINTGGRELFNQWLIPLYIYGLK